MRYSERVSDAKTLPDLWLISDERNDARLEASLRRLPRGSGFIYRHYHLNDPDRYQRFRELLCIAKGCDHTVILSDSALTAREWGADGIYGSPRALYPRRRDLLHIATAHNMREIGQANRIGADAIMLSPVFPTKSHPGSGTLGPMRFLMMAKYAGVPVIALGGMDQQYSKQMRWNRWAAIDGLSAGHLRPEA